jgi:hypothetical protein
VTRRAKNRHVPSRLQVGKQRRKIAPARAPSPVDQNECPHAVKLALAHVNGKDIAACVAADAAPAMSVSRDPVALPELLSSGHGSGHQTDAAKLG